LLYVLLLCKLSFLVILQPSGRIPVYAYQSLDIVWTHFGHAVRPNHYHFTISCLVGAPRLAAVLLTVSRFCLFSPVLTACFTRALHRCQDITYCTGLRCCCVEMSALIPDILITLFIILMMFITPDMVVTYPRDRLLSLRNHTAQLNAGQRSLVSQLGLRRRGCRAGAHCRRRLQVARSVTSSTARTSTPGEIPTIVGHRVVFVNKHQLIDARRDVGKATLTVLTPRSCSSNQLPQQPIVSSPLCSPASNSALLMTSACLRHEAENVVSISTSCNEEKEKAHSASQSAVVMSQNPSPQSVSTYISSKSLSVQLSKSNLESQLLLPSVQPTYQLKSNDTSLLYRYDSDIIDLSSSTSSDISPASIRSVPSLPSSLADADDSVCSALENSLDFYSASA